ncbi:hypothetical protein ABZY16_26805 [Streptomyces sp. NPDC006553]|uniref:hypothetical protein n=1 Tax=Streptomyces sp. NPDC006553 TaxID=3157180 RepID=UPI0033A72C0E
MTSTRSSGSRSRVVTEMTDAAVMTALRHGLDGSARGQLMAATDLSHPTITVH